MNEEPTSPGADSPEPTSASPQPPQSDTWSSNPQQASAAPAKSGPSVPVLAALAIVPAIIVGLIVFLVAGGSSSGGDGSSFAVLDGFVRLSLAQGEDIESYENELPEGFPDDMPVYGGAEMDGSFAIKSADGTTFIVTYSTTASKSDVYNFYLENLDKDPWQIELSREADDFTGMQFSRPDSADIQGSITISHSELDGRTAIFIFLLDSSQTSSSSGSDTEIPTESKELPDLYPQDLPIYEQDSGTIITETYFQRDAGQNAFLITFLTKDADIDVINYYTQEFQKRGWNVTDTPLEAGDFALSIDFDDGKPTKEIQGSVRAESYPEDADYTVVNLIVQASASRGRGN